MDEEGQKYKVTYCSDWVLVSVIAVFLGDHPKPNASTGGE